MSDDKHTNHAAESHLRSQQTGGHAKGGAPIDINSAFGRNADALKALMEGHDVELVKHGLTLTQMLNGETGSASSGGDAAQASSHGHGQSANEPILTSTSSQQSMVDIVGGRNSDRNRSSDDSGGRSI